MKKIVLLGACIASACCFSNATVFFGVENGPVYFSNKTFGSGANSFVMEFTEIGNPANTPETLGNPNPKGIVSYVYRMARYEVSREMLNKANVDGALGLTMADMTSFGGNGVLKPATGLSWYEAAKFVNWLNTSTGFEAAYKFDSSGNYQLWSPGDAGYNASNPFRNANAKYVLPSNAEWYKAAYGRQDGGWNYYTTGNITPTAVASATDIGNTIVYKQGVQGPADITSSGGWSSYATVGQGGNASEWSESAVDGINNDTSENRCVLGGYWGSTTLYDFDSNTPFAKWNATGIRVAIIKSDEITYVLTKTANTEQGSISLSADGIAYIAGSSLIATALPKDGYLFKNWTGSINANTASINITMDNDKNITANFIQDINDNDSDGLTNYQESIVFGTNPNVPETASPVSGLYLQSQYDSNKNTGKADVIAQPNVYGLYTASQMQAMAIGDLVLSKNPNGSFTLNYDIEQSTDLQTWTPYQALSLPLTGLPTDKAFVRIKAKQDGASNVSNSQTTPTTPTFGSSYDGGSGVSPNYATPNYSGGSSGISPDWLTSLPTVPLGPIEEE